MTMKILVANRGEIAIRIMRAAAELGISDRGRLHQVMTVIPCISVWATRSCVLDGSGPDAYLDMDGILTAAQVQPVYGPSPRVWISERECDVCPMLRSGRADVHWSFC